MVDNKPYGMTVHHMLDDPDQDEHPAATREAVPRSMARGGGVSDLAAWYAEQYQNTDSEADSDSSDEYACEFSDSDSDTYSESAITSEYSDEEVEDEAQYAEAGDIPGVEPGCGDGYIVTQPALDDVSEGFYPSSETQDEDHLDTYSLGEVYASSGIRRREDDNGLIHEIDWALFEFKDERQPDDNSIPAQAESLPPDVVHPNLGRACLRASWPRGPVHGADERPADRSHPPKHGLGQDLRPQIREPHIPDFRWRQVTGQLSSDGHPGRQRGLDHRPAERSGSAGISLHGVNERG